MDNNPFYSYSPIIDREHFAWPNGSGLAVYVGINIEYYEMEKPSAASVLQSTARRNPDPLNYGWKDYGNRVGIWRLMDIMDKFDIKASILLNSDVCNYYPRIIEEGCKRNWTWVAHGKNNSMFGGEEPPKLSKEEELSYLQNLLQTIYKATGMHPLGWLGPLGLSETFYTIELLEKLNVKYILDWLNDDQPFYFNKKFGKVLSLPYSLELNDLPLFIKNGLSGKEFGQMLIDQFDVLYAEAEKIPRVMPIALHSFVTGQAFRSKYVAQALSYITSHKDIWLTTSDEIATWWLNQYEH